MKSRIPVKLHAAAEGPLRVTISNDSVTTHGHRLSHAKGDIDLTRAKKGLPLLVSHDHDGLPVGRVHSIKQVAGELVGEVTFSARAKDYEQDARDGILTDVSVGVTFDPERVSGDDVPVIHGWSPIEVSLVSVGAIQGAVFHADGDPAPAAWNRSELDALFAVVPQDLPGLTGLRVRAYGHRQRTSEVADELARLVTEHQATQPSVPRVQLAADARDKFQAIGEVYMRQRTQLYAHTAEGKAQRAADQRLLAQSELRGMTLPDLALHTLHLQGIHQPGLARDQLILRALRGTSDTARTVMTHAGPMHTPSDFTSVITTNVNAALAMGYEEAPETWRIWTSTKPMNDFREHDFPVLSTFPDLTEVVDEGEFEHGTLSDKGESMTLQTWGKLIGITRRLIVNDNLNAFGSVPRMMGRAAARKVGDRVYSVLTTNGTMSETGRALFNATDGNLDNTSDVLSISNIQAGDEAMAVVTDPGGNSLGLAAAYLIVPVALKHLALAIVAAERDPSTTSASGDISLIGGVLPNTIRGLVPVVEHRLDATDAADWYLAASQAQVETVAVGFLNGVEQPFLDFEEGFSRDGITYKVRHDVTAGALDWRGLRKHA